MRVAPDVGLDKSIEDEIQLMGGNAGASVGDCEPDQR